MKLWDIAHSRTGDKGNISNISLIAYDSKDYELLKDRISKKANADNQQDNSYYSNQLSHASSSVSSL